MIEEQRPLGDDISESRYVVIIIRFPVKITWLCSFFLGLPDVPLASGPPVGVDAAFAVHENL